MKKIKLNDKFMPVMAIVALFMFMFICIIIACDVPDDKYEYDYSAGGDIGLYEDPIYVIDYYINGRYVELYVDKYTAEFFMHVQDKYENETLTYNGSVVREYNKLCEYMSNKFYIEVIKDSLWLKIK